MEPEITTVPLVETVAAIAQQLAEPNLALLERVVAHIGPEQALALLAETLEVEANGGLLVRSGKRRRTPGGTFFELTKRSLSHRACKRLFEGDKPSPEAPPSLPTPAAPQISPADAWAAREQALTELLHTKQIGKATTMKITLIGRPGQVKEQGPFVMTTLRAPERVPALPKGLPTPPPSKLVYVVYIAGKQWRAVAEAIQNPEDALIIEGFLTFDAELKKMSVYAQSVTTKLLQQAKRQTQKA